MNRTSLPLHEIVLKDRQRINLGDLDSLADSISQHGLLQPIVINQDKRLIAGGRRYLAHEQLGLTHIDVVYKETLNEAQLRMLELEENTKRKDFDWQEKCLAIAEWHQIKVREQVLAGDDWGQRETGDLLGVDLCSVNQALQIASFLKEKDHPDAETRKRAQLFWDCDSAFAALQLKRRFAIDLANAQLAALEKLTTNSKQQETRAQQIISEVRAVEEKPDLLAAERARYESNPLNVVPFDEYWAEKVTAARTAENTIYISNRFVQGDCIAYMTDPENAGRFDHVITDIPYGIDMGMLDQQNPHGGMADIDTVAEEHDVEENKELIKQFYPAAFRCTKDLAFVITWCDITNWQLMYDCAVDAGFAVQRWPITWRKTGPNMNQCATFNTTKDVEFAIVARKPKTTIAEQPNTSVVVASPVEMQKLTGHKFAKPFECWEYLLKLATLEGQLILEPFAGRGSGTLSMLRMKRNVISVELNVNHFNALMENVKTQHYLKQNPNYVFK